MTENYDPVLEDLRAAYDEYNAIRRTLRQEATAYLDDLLDHATRDLRVGICQKMTRASKMGVPSMEIRRAVKAHTNTRYFNRLWKADTEPERTREAVLAPLYRLRVANEDAAPEPEATPAPQEPAKYPEIVRREDGAWIITEPVDGFADPARILDGGVRFPIEIEFGVDRRGRMAVTQGTYDRLAADGNRDGAAYIYTNKGLILEERNR